MYKKGSCAHLDDWIDIVKNHKQPVNIEQVQLIGRGGTQRIFFKFYHEGEGWF